MITANSQAASDENPLKTAVWLRFLQLKLKTVKYFIVVKTTQAAPNQWCGLC
jgi:hypothetical protein